ncbi:MAG: hypothetical protein H7062_22355 [Candidatus Saccharimonas sp.]|nr:hypothetical protein [Planctomycetaceae bacterium]
MKTSTHKVYEVGGHPTVKYRNTSLSIKTLVADAWMPGWSEEHSTIAAKDGNKKNCALENLVPTSNARGKPAGGQTKRMAQIYQCYKLTNDTLLVAAEFDTSVDAVIAACKFFAP